DHGRSDRARMLGGIERRGLARGQRRIDGSGGGPRRRGRLCLPRDPHALTLALELDLAQPGLVEPARELAHAIGIDRRFAPVFARRLAGLGLGPLPRAPFRGANLSMASGWPPTPKPHRLALATGAMCEWWRNLSRAKTLLMWPSTPGTATAATASPMATEVWV